MTAIDRYRRGRARVMRAVVALRAHRGVRKWAVPGTVGMAVFVALRAVGHEQDWSGIGQARQRFEAARLERERAEQRLRLARREVQTATQAAEAMRALSVKAVREARALPAGGPQDARGRYARPAVHGGPASPSPMIATDAGAPAARVTPAVLPGGEVNRDDGAIPHDVAWRIAAAAQRSGLRIRRLSPAPAGQAAPADERSGASLAPRYDIAGAGGFGAVARWIRSLSLMPASIAPLRLEVTRQAGGAAFSARLAVIDAPAGADRAPANRAADPGDPVPVGLRDPGDEDFGGSEAATAPRLAGIVRDARRRLALLDDAGRGWGAAVGERVGAERIVRIDVDGIWLGTADGHERRVALDREAGR